ncbi:hypothetical protein PUNSTDRAFT_16499, partial [Punctularia strigosozonata HHB-11173 SS5]|uniref:uncharacterized protein n=1 Tax=Punctularia strigosozonata (strain HHB-11173) TaxID=741275 RepID=UPI0004416989
IPGILYFHAGGLVYGSRNDFFFPTWLKDAALMRGWLFLAADYRLLLPYTSYDQLEDVKALSLWLSSPSLSERLPPGVTLDNSSIMLAGTSAGLYIAMQFALHSSLQVKSLLALYG